MAENDDGVVEYGDRPRYSDGGYSDNLLNARLAGHDWGAVDDFLDRGTEAASNEGWGMGDILHYLGLGSSASTQARMDADARGRIAGDQQLADKLKNTTSPVPLTPLEGPAAERLASYARIDNLPVVQMPPVDFKGPPPSGLDLNDDMMRSSYARSLLNDEVRSPRDFAERYSGALAGAGGLDMGTAVRAVGELAAVLPSDRDFTDQAIAIAHSSGVALDADSVKTVRNNLIDHWTNTGQPLQDTYQQAQKDPAFATELTTPPQPEPSWFEKFMQMPAEQLDAEVKQSTDVGQGLTDMARDWYSWRMGQADIADGMKSWPDSRDELVKQLHEHPLDERAMDAAMGFVGGSIANVGARFGEAIGLLPSKLATAIEKMPEPTVKMIDPAAEPGTAPQQVPISKALEPVTPAERAEPPATEKGAVQFMEGYRDHVKERMDALEAEMEHPNTTPQRFRELDEQHGKIKEHFEEINTSVEHLEDDQVATIAREFGYAGGEKPTGPVDYAAEASPAQKVEALVRDVDRPEVRAEIAARNGGEMPKETDPDFFEKLAAGQDPETIELAKGHDATTGLFGMMRDFGLRLLNDESGRLNLFRTPKEQLERDSYVGARDFGRPMITSANGATAQFESHVYSTLDHWKTASGDLTNLFKLTNKHMPEWEGELDKGINGNPMGTMIGNMISYTEGRSMGAAMAHDNPLTPVADGIRYLNQKVRANLEDLHARGIINSDSYFEDYFRHMWKDPNKAATAFDHFTTMTGKLGANSGLKMRSLPTFEDGLKMGLEPAIRNPLELTVYDVMQKFKYGQAMEMIDKAKNTPNPMTGGKMLNWRVRPQGNEVELQGARMMKAVPNNPKGLILHAYADPGFANAWNDSFGPAFSRPPGAATGLYEKALYAKNTMTSLQLAPPVFHARTEIAEAWSSYTGNAISLLMSGHPIEAAKLAARIPLAPIDSVRVGRAWRKDFYEQMAHDPATQGLVDAGVRAGPRQAIYREGSAPVIWDTVKRGEIGKEFQAQVDRILGDPNNPTAYRVAWAPYNLAGAITHELGRWMNSAAGTLFDLVIPDMKNGVNVMSARTYLKTNPLATPEQRATRFKQIVQNTDDRHGEMNMDNNFWPPFAKKAAQLLMTSATWKYGSIRVTGNALGSLGYLATAGKAFTWNAPALSSVAGIGATYMMMNAVHQKLLTGQWAWETNTPLTDLVKFRTGGNNNLNGTPERGLDPMQMKEFWDWYKVLAFASVAPEKGIVAGAEYALGSLAPIWQFGRALIEGHDAIGHETQYTYGGIGGLAKRSFEPFFMSAMDERKKGTGIPVVETYLGTRPLNAPAQDWDAFMTSQAKVDRIGLRNAQQRARHENRVYERPRPIPGMAAPTDDTPEPVGKPRAYRAAR